MATSSRRSPVLEQSEVFVLIAKFLQGGPCQSAAKALVEDLERNEIIPKSVNWLGESFTQDFKTYSSKLDHVGSDRLCYILEQFLKAANQKESGGLVGAKSLLSSRAASLVVSPNSKEYSISEYFGRRRDQLAIKRRNESNSFVRSIIGREISGSGVGLELVYPEQFANFKLSCRTLGHLCAVYCILFDHSGKYIITGADDHLVKIWSFVDGRLIATLRGSATEITDLAVNFENTLLAVGNIDRLIRIWCLTTLKPVAVLTGHSGNVTSIFFCPIPRSRLSTRYLGSTSSDGSCAFWAYKEEPGQTAVFEPKSTMYNEKMRPGKSQMVCSSFSPGGIFMAAGSADSNVRVYYMLGVDGPERILEVEVHNERVDSIAWAHRGVRFVSGSKDGTALIFRFEHREWRYVRVNCTKPLPGQPSVINEDPKRRARVTMVAWNTDDTLVLTAVSDNLIKVWNSLNGNLVRILKAHVDEAYVIEPHPFNPRIVCTAGHDGKIFVWDIGTLTKEPLKPSEREETYSAGKIIYEHTNALAEGQGHGSIYDLKWNPDGLGIAATDSHGHLLIFNIGDRTSRFDKLPTELFFHTDYRPLTRDAITNMVLDEQTQVQPHLMPPPFLVDMDGNPYPPALQRLVPGREKCHDEQLVPNVAIAAGGNQEVIEGMPAFIQLQALQQQPFNPRSNIDVLIERLAIAQGHQGEQGGQEERRGLGNRRSGEVEGVRQSTGNWHQGGFSGYQRSVVPPLTRGTLAKSESIRHGLGDEEVEWYQKHKSKGTPTTPNPSISPTLNQNGRTVRTRRPAVHTPRSYAFPGTGRNLLDDNEGIARPNPPQMEVSYSQAIRNDLERRPRLPPVRRVPPTRPQPNRRRVRYNVRNLLEIHDQSDAENLPSDNSEESSNASDYSSNDSSSDSESGSDWEGGNAPRESRETRESTRPSTSRRRGQRSSQDAGSHEEEEPDTSIEEPQPGPSSMITDPKPKAKSKKKKVPEINGKDEIPKEFLPSEWLSEGSAKRSPYFPQIGDELVYFRQGHEVYVNAVEKNKVYEMTRKRKKALPWNNAADLPDHLTVRVVGIKHELIPPRVVQVKLAITDEDGEVTPQKIQVAYHDMHGIVDFLILKQTYDKSKGRNWNQGDRFRCVIDKKWYLGTVQSKEPRDRQFPDSDFLCYQIKWDSGDCESLSPWDMEVIPDDFGGEDGIQATEDDIRSGLYEAKPTDWNGYGHQEAECDRIAAAIGPIFHLSISEAFSTPVDSNAYPNYYLEIEYPMDLTLIKTRLENRFYRRVDALKFDIKYIASNAEKFNQKSAPIVAHSKIIRDLLTRIATEQEPFDVNAEYKELLRHYLTQTDSNTTKGIQIKNEPGTSRRTSSRPKKKNGKFQCYDSNEDSSDVLTWQMRCSNLLDRIIDSRDSVPFRMPVDIDIYTDYYQIIDTPMDLNTVKEDLNGGNYESPIDFDKDMNLIFINSRQYNTDKRSKIHQMTSRIKSMYIDGISGILNEWKASKRLKKKSSFVTASPAKPKTRSNIQNQRPTRNFPRISGRSGSGQTPRKNPTRNAAVRNQYINGHTSEDFDEDRDEPQGPNARIRNTGRFNLRNHTNGHSSMNGHASSFEPQPGPSRPRQVKRLRIDSDDSDHHEKKEPPKKKAKPIAPSPKKSINLRGIGKGKTPVKMKEESDSEDDRPLRPNGSKKTPVKKETSSDEDDKPLLGRANLNRGKGTGTVQKDKEEVTDEDDVPLSTLKKKKGKDPESDGDEFEASEEEYEMPSLKKVCSDEGESGENDNLRRSSRVKKKKKYDEDSDEAEGDNRTRSTRNNGRVTRKNYVENHNEFDEEDEAPLMPQNRKRTTRLETTESHENGDLNENLCLADRVKRSNRHATQPSAQSSTEEGGRRRPPKRKSAAKLNYQMDDEDEDEEEYEDPNDSDAVVEEESAESDPDEPGPSSKLYKREKRGLKVLKPKGNEDEDFEEEGQEEEEEDNDDSDYEEEVGGRTSRRKPTRAPPPSRNTRRGGTREAVEETSRTRTSNRRGAGGSGKPNYNEGSEDSDEEPPHFSVSSRGRVRRVKSFHE